MEISKLLPQIRFLGIVGVSGFAVGVLIGSIAMRKFKLQGSPATFFIFDRFSAYSKLLIPRTDRAPEIRPNTRQF